MSAPTSPDWVLSPDWVFSNGSNVSLAKDRGWFTSYTPFTSSLGSFIIATDLPVLGIGSVSIPVKLEDSRKRKQHSVLVIDDVLHAPSAICNILGQGDFMDRYDTSQAFGPGRALITDREGRAVACFDPKKPLLCLKLSGPPVGPATGPSMFSDPSTHFAINVQWPDSERARWQIAKLNPKAALQPIEPYSAAEKTWLKQHFQNEFRFLRQYGLSTYKEDDREEGRTLLRSLMIDDVSDGSSNLASDDDANSFLEEIEADPTSHMSDYHFTEEQLDWIKKHYRHSGNFMICYGLKPYEDEDCHEAKAIVAAMMDDSKDE